MIGHKRIPSREGGVEIVVEELSTRLVKMCHTVHVYNRKGHHVSGKDYNNSTNTKEYKGVKLINIPTFENVKLNAIVYSFLATLRALLGRYDVIHYHAEGPCSMIWIPKLFGIRTIATIHGLDWQRSKWGGFATWFLKFGEKMAAKYADEVIVLSNNVKKYFKDTYNRDVNFIPNGVERPIIKNAEIIKNKYGLDKDSYILFLARIVPEKGLHYLIDAFKDVQTEKKLIIAGGSSHTDDYFYEIQNKAKQDVRIIMTGFVQGQELEELYSNAYVYVLPSDVEGMPISLLEAMSYGNCCLVSSIPECTEVVEDKAVVFKQSNIDNLKENLNHLIKSPAETCVLQSNSSKFICEKYSWDDVVKNIFTLYKYRD